MAKRNDMYMVLPLIPLLTFPISYTAYTLDHPLSKSFMYILDDQSVIIAFIEHIALITIIIIMIARSIKVTVHIK